MWFCVNTEKKVLEVNNFDAFNEMQKKCIEKGFEKNLVVSAPTASGKTIIAELFMNEYACNKRKKVIYTCPLRALAHEHYKDFKKKYPELSFALSTGDFDSNSSYLKKFDVIFSTYEKLESLIRHDTEWLKDVGNIIVDEIHELDSDRGPVIEVSLTQMRTQNPELKILALSATIPNSKEIAGWLNANLVESSFRPTKLKEGVMYNNNVFYSDNSKEDGSLEQILENLLKENKQALIFLNSRKRAETLAKQLGKNTSPFINNQTLIEKTKNKILSSLEQPTEQCKALAGCISKGIAFHHAGLVQKQKTEVEDSFRKGTIKVICATPTLSAGINLPADAVIIPSLYRFNGQKMDLISVREYKQQAGRSGRPKFSSEGKSILLAKTETQKELYLDEFILGELEPVNSHLGIVPILRTHILGLISTQFIYDVQSIESFFEKSFYGHQFGNMQEILDEVVKIIKELEEEGFVESKNGKYIVTKIGKRVSDLFLDPDSASQLLKSICSKKAFTNFSYLYTWVNCTEFTPLFRAKAQQRPILVDELNLRLNEIPFGTTALFDYDAANKFLTARVIEEWINETGEQTLLKDFGVAPGSLLQKNRVVEWLSYATIELSKLVGETQHLIPVKQLARRTKNGVREELLPLTALRGVGRVRARKLFRKGIKTPSELKKNKELAKVTLGPKIFSNLSKQLKIVR